MGSKEMQPLAAGFWSISFKPQLLHKAQFPPKDTDLSGKVAIITGGTRGLDSNPREKGKTTALKLQAEYPKATIKVWMLDMCSYDSVQKFVSRVEGELPRLDIAILNAGRSKLYFELIPNTGHEENLQVNYLSTVLLATMLLPILKSKSPQETPGRLSIVTSGTTLFTKFSNHQQSPLLKSFDDIKTAPAPGVQSYGATKLLSHMFLYKLIDCVSADDVVVNLVDPGATRGTGLGRDLPKILATLVTPIKAALGRTLTDGASTYLDATIAKGKESHGCFLMDWEIRPFPPLLYTTQGKDTIEILWQETLNEFHFADIRSVLKSMKTN